MKIILSYLYFTISALGASLTIKAAVGVSSFNSMNLAISNVIGMKIGTVTMFFNAAFLIAYIILTDFKFPKKYILQTLSFLLFGSLINFFTYTLFSDFILTNYLLRLSILTVGVAVAGMSIGMIIRYNTITFPLESLCVTISEKTSFSFVQLRYSVDVVSVMISVTLSISNGLPLYVREGTLISMLLFSSMMNLTRKEPIIE